jgi:hypothetical protein
VVLSHFSAAILLLDIFPIMSEISVAQTLLSEELQLLDEFHYSDLDMAYRSAGVRNNKDIRDPDTQRVLDLIAVCLTTGKPGDVVAAAFDKREHIRLVLAKNGDFHSEDYDYAYIPFRLDGHQRLDRPFPFASQP